MTKADVVEKIASSGNISKVYAGQLFNTLMDIMAKGLKEDEKVNFVNFGCFVVKTRKDRRVRNPRTREFMDVQGSKTVKFRISGQLKDTFIDQK